MTETVTARAWIGSALTAALIPALWLGDTLRPHMTPGIEGAGLWRTLREAAQWRSGAGGAAWPRAPLPTLVEALLPADPALAHGIVTVAGVWLTGFGAWHLARVHARATLPVCALVALLAQASPTVMRAVPGADLAALGVGALALALAFPRHAWWAGAWSAPVAATLALCGAVRAALARGDAVARAEARALALGGLSLLGLLGSHAPDAPTPAIAPAYVTATGATFPLPEAEAAPLRLSTAASATGTWLPAGVQPSVHGNVFHEPPPSEGDAGLPTWGEWLIPVQRIHGGLVALFGGLAGVLLARHRWMGAVSLLCLGILTLAVGWQAAPGEVERGARAVDALRGWMRGAARDHALAFSVVPVTLGLVGLAGWFGRIVSLGPRLGNLALTAVGVALLTTATLLENPRWVAFRAMLPPDPVLAVLRAGPPGDVLVFPPPHAPWHAGAVSAARVDAELSMVGRRAATEGSDVTAALLALVQRADIPIDVQAARTAWEAHGTDSFARTSTPGWRWLLLDTRGLAPGAREAMDGWLAATIGMPIARSDARLLYDRNALSMAPAGVRPEGITPTEVPHVLPGTIVEPEVPAVRPAP